MDVTSRVTVSEPVRAPIAMLARLSSDGSTGSTPDA
ncbi:hypothetical protein BC477_04055 [Clavibacter michiganensis subsp. michiganensis]|uniref:Uncharacterized protein n=1 Tax=Clavibacter michiganensis subsp. michiganensis TaxID=33013 RepID=A0A251XK56_CLAMM|nr:hypothetical protein BC477_04055 [Clavibacter michiganensis subsp. michiganensis]OUE03885.1 hypothetical protein CMMCAS07_02990 [Clavibacter michiganensis subsp. michiganensis]